MFKTSSDKVNENYSLSLGLLNTEHKPSVKKKRSTGLVSDRSTGVDFEFYRLGRVEKILAGSISAPVTRWKLTDRKYRTRRAIYPYLGL